MNVTRGFSAESRRRLSEADRRWRIKTIMRSAAAVFSLIALSLYAAAIPKWDDNFYWGAGPNRGDWQDGFPLGVLVFALLWNLVSMFLLLGRKLPLRPWIPLTGDLLVWAALVPAITWSAGDGMFLNWNQNAEFWDPWVWNAMQKIGSLELGGVVLACFVWVIHFVLFVYACIETHKWRKAKKATPPSVRALEHGEFVQHHDSYAAPPKYEENVHTRDIEMSPTSPTAREFV